VKSNQPPPSSRPGEVAVWDPLLRIFHWSLVVFFSVAWLSGDEWASFHEWAGYTVAALIAFRVVWGLIGTRHARFSDFVYRPATIREYLLTLPTRRVRHYLGHNPAGGAMVLVMLVMLALLAGSGMLLIAGEGGGPLAGTALAGWSGEWVEEVHEFLGDFMLLLVFVHIVGVFVASRLHGENLVRAMLTGRKPRVQEGS